MKRLNIFVDETGEFGFKKGTSSLYGVSFTFHEQNDDISKEIIELNKRLSQIGYFGMIHTADLIMKRNDYKDYPIEIRKSIFRVIYHFTRKVKVRYTSIFVDKKYTENKKILKRQLMIKINEMVNNNLEYFNRFDRIVMYYDNGQEMLSTILETIFYRFNGFEHRINFDHKEKRLFQVSDMLTFVDKYNYKYKNKLLFTNGERYFFTQDEIRKILNELSKKRL